MAALRRNGVEGELLDIEVPTLFTTANPLPFPVPEIALGCLCKPYSCYSVSKRCASPSISSSTGWRMTTTSRPSSNFIEHSAAAAGRPGKARPRGRDYTLSLADYPIRLN